MRRIFISFLLAFIFPLVFLYPVEAETFIDVSPTAWYADDIADVQQYGIIHGMGDNKFMPEDVLTYAQAITLAANTYAYQNGDTITKGETVHWYDPYVNYALKSGLINAGDISQYHTFFDMPCTRSFMAALFYACMSNTYTTVLNDIEKIPDVKDNDEGHAIYSLYRFGILTGNDKYGTFYPEKSITRAETSAILNRVLNIDKRQIFSLVSDNMTPEEAIALALPIAENEHNSMNVHLLGESGGIWESDSDVYIVVFQVAETDDENQPCGGFCVGYWVNRNTGEVRYVGGFQDYWPGMIDLKTGTMNEYGEGN